MRLFRGLQWMQALLYERVAGSVDFFEKFSRFNFAEVSGVVKSRV